MRDGVVLQTVIWRPDGARGPLPILLLRTADELPSPDDPAFAALVRDGYYLAFQHVRGAGGSEGRFVFCRPASGRGGVDEATDTYDTVDWLVKNVRPTNGRVGMLGGGYSGWAQLAALAAPHPSLRAISPESPIVDLWHGDLFFHRGAFRLASVVEWLV